MAAGDYASLIESGGCVPVGNYAGWQSHCDTVDGDSI